MPPPLEETAGEDRLEVDQPKQVEEPKGTASPELPLRKKRGRPPKAKGIVRSVGNRQEIEATGAPESSPSINVASSMAEAPSGAISSALKTCKGAEHGNKNRTGIEESQVIRSV
ncbi:hypothetical protein S7711_11222 [Stachybotrys chartarum IBT 7711]|uniref:Uncharacterized protein n=1 Tax=Stachybotrys chartarum (strain CBS 109288 / IBT 7711) TaxID=1280523 RepID=A0A084AIF7_STACB|nr:hypothetical protein S7711_11222 [Stachybotrys chartarum IBT 7711]KFA74123.1 hypothetical protein S40288_10847 [Stachybotrys chartarum IBT 40288]